MNMKRSPHKGGHFPLRRGLRGRERLRPPHPRGGRRRPDLRAHGGCRPRRGAGRALALHGRGQPDGTFSPWRPEGFFFSIMIAVPETGAERPGRRSGGADRLSVPCARNPRTMRRVLGAGHIRLHAGDGHARRRWRRAGPGNGLGRGGRRRIRDLPARRGGRIPLRFGEALARNPSPGRTRSGWRMCIFPARAPNAGALPWFWRTGANAPPRRCCFRGEEFSYAAVFGLTGGGETPENAAMLERLLDSLALS